MTFRATETKIEVDGEGHERARYRPRPGQGGPSMASTTRQLLRTAERELLHGRAALLEAIDGLTGVREDSTPHRELQRARGAALARIGLAARLLSELSRGGQSDASGEKLRSLDLRAGTVVAIAAEATEGQRIYCALERPNAGQLVNDLAERLVRRALVLVAEGPGWYSITGEVVAEAPRCAACGSTNVRHSKCQRCGTRTP